MLTPDSRLREVYINPVGRDIIRKLLMQTGTPEIIFNNPIIGAIKLKSLPAISFGRIDSGFIGTLLQLLNSQEVLLKRGERRG
jgi:oligo-1,6-glucosidase